MSKYIIRLDDASCYMDINKWNKVEDLFDKYNIKPLFGIIPDNKDPQLTNRYVYNPDFWELMHAWIAKGWVPAMHGCEHRYVTEEGGINPVNKKSEFAGLPYEVQAEKIRRAWKILNDNRIRTNIFFAPSHTFDTLTIDALKNETDIRIISDTIACNVYKENEFWYIPQQCGSVRRLPFRTITFCYHPNTMNDQSYSKLEKFIKRHEDNFVSVSDIKLKDRKRTVIDDILRALYMSNH